MDAGVIAKIKGRLRGKYSAWGCQRTCEQLTDGKRPEDVQIAADVQTCKKNLTRWLGEIREDMNAGAAKVAVRQMWVKTKLMGAWQRDKQIAATRKLKELFPQMDSTDYYVQVDGGVPLRDHSDEPDIEAGLDGAGFMQPIDEDEHELLPNPDNEDQADESLEAMANECANMAPLSAETVASLLEKYVASNHPDVGCTDAGVSGSSVPGSRSDHGNGGDAKDDDSSDGTSSDSESESEVESSLEDGEEEEQDEEEDGGFFSDGEA